MRLILKYFLITTKWLYVNKIGIWSITENNKIKGVNHNVKTYETTIYKWNV